MITESLQLVYQETERQHCCLFSNLVQNTWKSVNIVGLHARNFKGRNDKGESNTFIVLLCSRKWKDSVIVLWTAFYLCSVVCKFHWQRNHDQVHVLSSSWLHFLVVNRIIFQGRGSGVSLSVSTQVNWKMVYTDWYKSAEKYFQEIREYTCTPTHPTYTPP